MAWVKTPLVICVFVLATFVASVTHAAKWVVGNINQIGTNETVTWITITPTDGSFTGSRYFYLSATNTNTMMATALTAQSAGNTVNLYVDSINKGATCRSVVSNN